MHSANRLMTLLILAVLSAGPAAAKEASKASGSQRPLKQYSMEQFTATTTVRGASFSADGKTILLSSNETGIFNAFSLAVAGGKAEALTKSTTEAARAQPAGPLGQCDTGGTLKVATWPLFHYTD